MAGGGQQQQQSSGEYAPIWISVSICVVLVIAWYFGHTYISLVLFKLRLAEIKLASYFSSNLAIIQNRILMTPPDKAKFQFIAEISSAVGKQYLYPVSGLIGIFAFLLYLKGNTNSFNKTYTMKSLANQEQKNWPQIKPVSPYDLVNTHIHEGPWAMCMTPMQFAKKHKLIELKKEDSDEVVLANRKKVTIKINEQKSTQLFAQQLGRPWLGVNHLPIHAQALFAIFAAKANADRNAANQLLRQISDSATNLKQLNFTGTDALLKKYEKTKLVEKAVSIHAYELTVMASMIEIARLDGVIATAEFLWLKPVDRPLWYMLNNVGRRTAFTEVAGPYAHWLAEKAISRRLVVPMIAEATLALQSAMADIIYSPDQDF